MSALTTVKVWVNAFIPDTVPDVTHAAPDSGTVVNGPPPPLGGGCYRTDNRGFSSDIHASSRMHSEVEIAIEGPQLSFQFHDCSPTHKIDCDTGEALCDAKGDASRMQFTNLRGNTTVDPEGGVIVDPNASLVQIDLDDAAHNPCVASPDIDAIGTVSIDPVARTVRFQGAVEPFPAFEMYATGDNGAPVTLFQLMPRPGADPFNLVGEPNRSVDVTITL